jgi:hypothetical protein
VLEGNEPEAEKRLKLERLIAEPNHLWTQEYRTAVNRNETATLVMLADLLGNLTENQRQHIQAALETLKNDFIILSKQ